MTAIKMSLWFDMRVFIPLNFQTYPRTVPNIKPELWFASEHQNFSVSGDDMNLFGDITLTLILRRSRTGTP